MTITKVMIIESNQTRGWDNDNKGEENKSISPKLIRLSSNHACKLNDPYISWCRKG